MSAADYAIAGPPLWFTALIWAITVGCLALIAAAHVRNKIVRRPPRRTTRPGSSSLGPAGSNRPSAPPRAIP